MYFFLIALHRREPTASLTYAYYGHPWASDDDCFAEMCIVSDLPDGIRCVLQYDPDEILQCILYGAIFNITISPNITTTSTENSSMSQNTATTESSSTSQSITSASVEGSKPNNDKTMHLTSSASTESETTIYTTPKGSTDMTAKITNGMFFLLKNNTAYSVIVCVCFMLIWIFKSQY